LLPDCRYPVGGRPGGAPVRAGCGPSVAFRRAVVACPGPCPKGGGSGAAAQTLGKVR